MLSIEGRDAPWLVTAATAAIVVAAASDPALDLSETFKLIHKTPVCVIHLHVFRLEWSAHVRAGLNSNTKMLFSISVSENRKNR